MTPTRQQWGALLLAGITVALATACGGSPSTSGRASAGITLHPPSGWTVRVLPQPGGLVIARTDADLTATTAAGPRLTVVPNTSTPTAQSLVASIDRRPMYAPTVIQKIFGNYGLVPTLRFTTEAASTSGETEELIPMTVAPGKTYVFTLEAPSATWAQEQKALEAIVSDADVKPANFPS